MKRLLGIVAVVAVCLGIAGAAAAQSRTIDGVWLGTYTSTYSSNPTKEILIFKTTGNQIVGAYLSASQSAGTLVGYQFSGNVYTFLVTGPVAGCPPASGTLTATVNQGALQYEFVALPCKGSTDVGKGTGVIADAKALAAFSGSASASAVSIAGLWNGVYTSTFSTSPTKETLFFANFGTTTQGIYVSESGGAGLLSGQVSSSSFALSDFAPSPPCPGRAVFQGNKGTSALAYSFQATDCQGTIDIGKGEATPASP